jgi:hypothetical protein
VTPGGITASFDGNPAVGFLPPDTVGAVGPNHYIQAVNNVFSIYDRLGNLLAGPSAINSLWTGFGGPCESLNSGDPIVMYDHLADRWIISQFTLPSANHQCVAVSRTPDPVSGGWYLYDFTTPPNDYPKISVWPDGYYMSSQRGFFGSGLDVYVFDRVNMLAGAPTRGTVQFFVPAPLFTIVMLPSYLDGPPPPAGTPNFFARPIDGDVLGGVDRIELYAFSVDWNNLGASTFTALPSLPTAPFNSVLCAPGSLRSLCAPQPGTSQKLDAPGVWPMWRLQYRNFGAYETLVFNHTVNADGAGRAGIRWYELRRPSGAAWSIFQQGTFSPADDVYRWMASAAMDAAGNIALGYSASSSTVYPSIRYTGRLATDPPGVMTLPEVTIVAGGGSQTHFSGRWGDYSTLSIDPVNPCQFWFTTEYIPNTTVAGWKTRIAAFTLNTLPPSITCPADITVCNDPGQCSAVVNYTVTVTDNCSGTVLVCVPPPGSVFPKGTTTVGCAATDASGNTATCHFNVTVRDCEAPQISCSVAKHSLWPPNHNLVNVGLAVNATENCPGAAPSLVVQVFSNEDDQSPTGEGNFSPDARNIAAGTLRLRSERQGNAHGRVYLIVATATDASGNKAFDCCTVVVPHSQSNASIASINAQATSAKIFCLAHNGASPPGYFVVGDGPIVGPKQ